MFEHKVALHKDGGRSGGATVSTTFDINVEYPVEPIEAHNTLAGLVYSRIKLGGAISDEEIGKLEGGAP